jgi:large subunit GTPase 1
MRSGQGNPDEARAARYILKDYVDGKLLYCHPPPGVLDTEFNRPTHKNAVLRLIGKKHAPITRVGKSSATFVPFSNLRPSSTGLKETRSDAIDNSFFDLAFVSRLSRPLIQQSGKEFSRLMLYPHQNTVAADGTAIDPRHARLLSLLENVDKDKKHRTMKRVKQRSGRGYDV